MRARELQQLELSSVGTQVGMRPRMKLHSQKPSWCVRHAVQEQEGVLYMKCTVGALTVLLLVTTVSLGQQSPFPQAANPYLAISTTENTSPASDLRHDLPSSMAANQASAAVVTSPTVVVDESPFPTAANPSLALGTSSTAGLSPVVVDESGHDNGSPFPIVANPAR